MISYPLGSTGDRCCIENGRRPDSLACVCYPHPRLGTCTSHDRMSASRARKGDLSRGNVVIHSLHNTRRPRRACHFSIPHPPHAAHGYSCVGLLFCATGSTPGGPRQKAWRARARLAGLPRKGSGRTRARRPQKIKNRKSISTFRPYRSRCGPTVPLTPVLTDRQTRTGMHRWTQDDGVRFRACAWRVRFQW